MANELKGLRIRWVASPTYDSDVDTFIVLNPDTGNYAYVQNDEEINSSIVSEAPSDFQDIINAAKVILENTDFYLPVTVSSYPSVYNAVSDTLLG